MALCRLIALGCLGLACNASLAVAQVSLGPAPAGQAANVAQTIIRDNFEKSACPAVSVAQRYPDGSIVAVCSNDEKFRVFSMDGIGPVALRCSAAAKLGIQC